MGAPHDSPLRRGRPRQPVALDPAEAAAIAADRANELIDDKLLTVSWRPVQVVLAANLGFVLLIHLLA